MGMPGRLLSFRASAALLNVAALPPRGVARDCAAYRAESARRLSGRPLVGFVAGSERTGEGAVTGRNTRAGALGAPGANWIEVIVRAIRAGSGRKRHVRRRAVVARAGSAQPFPVAPAHAGARMGERSPEQASRGEICVDSTHGRSLPVGIRMIQLALPRVG